MLTSRHNIRSICDNYFAVHKFWNVFNVWTQDDSIMLCLHRNQIEITTQNTRLAWGGRCARVRAISAKKIPSSVTEPWKKKVLVLYVCNNLIIAFKWKTLRSSVEIAWRSEHREGANGKVEIYRLTSCHIWKRRSSHGTKKGSDRKAFRNFPLDFRNQFCYDF